MKRWKTLLPWNCWTTDKNSAMGDQFVVNYAPTSTPCDLPKNMWRWRWWWKILLGVDNLKVEVELNQRLHKGRIQMHESEQILSCGREKEESATRNGYSRR